MGRNKINKKKKKKMLPAKVNVPQEKVVKITSLTDKCLKKVCYYLGMDDLSNLAASCTRFTRVCNETFELNFQHLYSNFQIRVFDLDDKQKFMSYANMFTHFGKYIKKLRVEYDAVNNRDNQKMHELIDVHCCDSLAELHIFEMVKFMKFNKLFKQLIQLKFTRCHLNGSIISFEKWCPNIQHLEFEMVQSVASTTCIERKFPKLIEFSLLNIIDCNFSVKNMRNFIKNNPQLKRLRICRDIFGVGLNITNDYISYVDRMLPDLELLEMIYMHRWPPKQSTDSNQWTFKKLVSLQMTCHVANTLLLMKSVTTIKQLEINIQNGATKQTLDYIMSCPNLQKFTWFLNKTDELNLLFKLSKTTSATLTELKLFIGFGRNDKIYSRLPLVNVIDFMVYHKQIENIIVGFQMTNHNKCLFNALSRCENTSEFFDVEYESSDDDEDIVGDNFENLFHFLQSYGKVVEHKFNGVWKIAYYLHKMPSKLMPVSDNLFICAEFIKNLSK